MKLTENEIDILGDMREDSFELWEWYNYTRTNHPEMSEEEIVRHVRELLVLWLKRGWLKIFKSREDMTVLSEENFFSELDRLGMDAADPEKSRMVLDLTKRAGEDVEWLGPIPGVE